MKLLNLQDMFKKISFDCAVKSSVKVCAPDPLNEMLFTVRWPSNQKSLYP